MWQRSWWPSISRASPCQNVLHARGMVSRSSKKHEKLQGALSGCSSGLERIHVHTESKIDVSSSFGWRCPSRKQLPPNTLRRRSHSVHVCRWLTPSHPSATAFLTVAPKLPILTRRLATATQVVYQQGEVLPTQRTPKLPTYLSNTMITCKPRHTANSNTL